MFAVIRFLNQPQMQRLVANGALIVSVAVGITEAVQRSGHVDRQR